MEGTIEDRESEVVNVAFTLLYMRAYKEQAEKDSRIISPRMRDILQLKEWYFEPVRKD
jgi:hypothetical protein